MPTDRYWKASIESDLAWRIAQAVKEGECHLSAGHLETKEIRNCVLTVLRARMEYEREHGRCRLVTPWLYVPVDEEAGET